MGLRCVPLTQEKRSLACETSFQHTVRHARLICQNLSVRTVEHDVSDILKKKSQVNSNCSRATSTVSSIIDLCSWLTKHLCSTVKGTHF